MRTCRKLNKHVVDWTEWSPSTSVTTPSWGRGVAWSSPAAG